MAQFTFRLAALLEQKVEADKKARAAVVEKQRRLEEEQSELARLRDQEELVRTNIWEKRRERLSTGGNQASELQRRNAYLDGLAQDLSTAHDRVVVQESAVDDADRVLKAAQVYAKKCAREAETLAKYRSELEKRFLTAEAKKEELELDELGTTMYLSRGANA